MFIGHFGVGFGAKAAVPRVSLGTLFLGAQFIDLLWPTLLLLGLERVAIEPGITRVTPLDFQSYPISHSLALVSLWAVLVGAGYWLIRRHATGAIVLTFCVVSHWFLDLIVHRPDLPLTPTGSARFGFGLWNSLGATVALELTIFLIGVAIYLRATAPLDRTGSYALVALLILLLAIYAGNLFGPPPPDVRAIAYAGHAQWLLVLFGYWADRHRTARTVATAAPVTA